MYRGALFTRAGSGTKLSVSVKTNPHGRSIRGDSGAIALWARFMLVVRSVNASLYLLDETVRGLPMQAVPAGGAPGRERAAGAFILTPILQYDGFWGFCSVENPFRRGPQEDTTRQNLSHRIFRMRVHKKHMDFTRSAP